MKLARLTFAFCATLSLSLPSHAMPVEQAGASPALVFPIPENEQGWQEWGSGEMRLYGFRLYRATLWVAGNALNTSPHALTLHYRRDISRQQLVSASLDEMRRQGAEMAQLARWKPDLERVFPDVKEGERIIGLHQPNQSARFYHQGKLTGEIKDAEFARRFFGIWLNSDTRSPEVRSLLLKPPRAALGR